MATAKSCASSGRDRRRRTTCASKKRISRFKHLLWLASGAVIASLALAPAYADTPDCSVDGTTLNCEGEHSAGIRFVNSDGLDVTVNTGSPDDLISIDTTAAGAGNIGITAISTGTAPAPQDDAFLGIPIPGQPGVGGGVVTVNNFGDITTSGEASHGIYGRSRNTGYPASVEQDLEDFRALIADGESGVSFGVDSVTDSDGNPTELGTTVAGSLGYEFPALGCDPAADVTCGDDLEPEELQGTAGTFTIYEDGSFAFDEGDDFADLEVGETRTTSVEFTLNGTRTDHGSRSGIEGLLVARVTMTEDGLEFRFQTVFGDYGEHFLDSEDDLVFPDLEQYVNGLIAQVDAGGSGNSVNLNHYAGQIVTDGLTAYGVFGESHGGDGRHGNNGGGFWSFGLDEPTRGTHGTDGGNVTITIDGGILTKGDESLGVFAYSRGGSGGGGGNGGFYYGGRRGGDGGDGNAVEVFGSGGIETLGDSSSGIMALSVGGAGGHGGDGGVWAGGYGGGFGGDAGTVNVDGSWNILTHGDFAHGIWAKSVGGSGGAGGSGGWFFGGAGSGGEGSDGGNVRVDNNGAIETLGNYAFGIHAQSVGGFGGSGGLGISIFAASGGDGESAGSGGDVTVRVGEDGLVITGREESGGEGSHAIFAQSVGGGGGSGGGSGGLFYAAGGDGAAGGNGGAVSVENFGLIETFGLNARGIFAQSIGGGGGDGGFAGALVGSGGSGSAASIGGRVDVDNFNQVVTHGVMSDAIFAQSIGGGGGSGGAAGGLVAIGGAAGQGGSAGDVDVANAGLIRTEGDYSRGVFAQSVGGGGGDGGGTGGWFASLGGSGGSGGLGGKVDILNEGLITTDGAWSHSVFAQSIGGGGGSGGGSGGVWVTIGGGGGNGNDGGVVSVTNDGMLMTGGVGARGIHAQSIGGGGGSGGGAGAITVAVGGSGGGGGLGGDVFVDNAGSILTANDMAQGVFAQSVGGSGGDGGNTGSMLVTIGGGGGEGADGGNVDVDNSGLIATLGNNATGVFAQSVGGSGGSGGNATSVQIAPVVSFTFALGGEGGTGGNGGSVNVDNTGTIRTAGSNSHAVFAQSVGGSGGSGGSATTISAVFPVPEVEFPTISANISIGGLGAGGGEAGIVDVYNSGEILTEGFRSYGVYAQSVGGSGGDGGNATNVQLAIDADFTASVAIGGDAGAGGIGNTVIVENDGVIHTRGDHANAVFAQSVGGGGGAGGDATTISMSVSTPPLEAEDAIPMPGGSFTLAVGGNGGAGGIGGDVTVTNTGSILTEGHFATGVMAQSIGGSGGIGGDARSIQIDVSGNPVDYLPLIDLMSFDTTLVIGGSGGTGGDAGKVHVTNENSIATRGAFAHGIVAQSVGGGGGAGGSAIVVEIGSPTLEDLIPGADDIGGATSISMTLQGDGGGGGNGDRADVISYGDILTDGDFATGIIAQSIGGGGGIAGMYNPLGTTGSDFADTMIGLLVDTDAGISFMGSTGGDGDAGIVFVDHTGTIQTSGDAAHGLFAQSAAGKGTAAGVEILLDGSIYTFGDKSYGIYAQSGGLVETGDIKLTLGTGTVMGGTGTGAGIFIADGANNTIGNEGLITSLPGIYGRAIVATGGDETVTNLGSITGSVYLGGGSNRIDNYGTLYSGAVYDLGYGNLVSNAGWIAPGGIGKVFVTDLFGDLEQTIDGALLFDLDFATNLADRLNIHGVADLDGALALRTWNAGNIVPGLHDIVLVKADGGITSFGLGLEAAESAVVGYSLVAGSATEYVLNYNVDFAPAALNENQAAMGEHVNDIQLAGGSKLMEPLTASIVAIPDVDSLAVAYDRMSPHIYAANQVSRFYSSLDFERAMHSCPIAGEDLSSSAEGECFWMRVSDRDVTYEASDGSVAGTDYAKIVNLGLQRSITDRWFGGVALGIERSDYEIPLAAERFGHQVQIGGILKGRFGADSLNLSINAGFGDYTIQRTIGFPASGNRTMADRDIDFLAAHAGYSHSFDGDKWFVRPGVDIGWTRVRGDAVEERGAGAADLVIRETEDTYLSSRADILAGLEFTGKRGTVYRPYVGAAYTHLFDGSTNRIVAHLAGAPSGVADFMQVLRPDEALRSTVFGLDVFTRNSVTLSLAFERQSGDTWDVDAAYGRMIIPF